jgi:hypothetical protein
MAFAQGSRSRLAFGVESAFGSAASSYTNLPFNTHSLNLSKERVAGNEIQPDRMPRVDRHGNRSVAGDITVDLRDSAYDDLLESAMLSTFSTNVLTVGTTPKFLTLEDYAEDIGQARLFTGCTVSTMNVSMAPNQMVSATFGMVGKDMTISGTGKTVAAAGVGEPFDAYSGSLLVADVDGIGGATALSTVTSVDFTLTNSFAPTFVVGSDSAPQLEFGRAEIEGTITAYFDDVTPLVNRFLDETESAIQVSVAEGTTAGDNVMTFLFPRVKFNAADIPVDGPTSRIVTLPFVALFDDAEDPGTNLKITTSTV